MSKKDKKSPASRMQPARTPEARENQLISLAVDLAEKQLAEGTASSQVITHYLKLGTMKEKLERDILASQKKLIEAKTSAMESAKHVEEMYAEALNAMRAYNGQDTEQQEDEFYDY
ncbi:hypothetical protein [Phocaeicola sp.]|jgi:hypothetical protein|uniref:hypothetical protein n=1 Tax=Phocaeicola sp. TaxID=2773926 RepID=UPI003AB59F36